MSASSQVPNISTEDSTDDNLPLASAAEPAQVEYYIVPYAAKHGGDMLTDSLGFSYTKNLRRRDHQVT